jgi:hypothetical protein
VSPGVHAKIYAAYAHFPKTLGGTISFTILAKWRASNLPAVNVFRMALLPVFEYLSCGELFGITRPANSDRLSGRIPQMSFEWSELSITQRKYPGCFGRGVRI